MEGLKESTGEEDGRKRTGGGRGGRRKGGKGGGEGGEGGGGEGETCSKTVVLPVFVDLSISNVFSFGRREVVGLLHIRNESVSELFTGGAGGLMERRGRWGV